jgi:hypothetical protein
LLDSLEALAAFVEQQRAILARTQDALTQLRKLRTDAALATADVALLADKVRFLCLATRHNNPMHYSSTTPPSA